ncbi:unnamed protein product [[Candida] boidinii]|nr:unnamed protein product [[Candida] boidinii]
MDSEQSRLQYIIDSMDILPLRQTEKRELVEIKTIPNLFKFINRYVYDLHNIEELSLLLQLRKILFNNYNYQLELSMHKFIKVWPLMDHYLKSGHGSKHLRPTKNNSYNDLIFTQPFTCRCTTRGASKKSKSNSGNSSSNIHGNNNGNSASGFENDDNLSDSDIEDPKINMHNLNHPINSNIHEDLDDTYDNHDKSDINDANSNSLMMAKVVSSNKPESEISFSAKRRRQTKVTVYQNPCLYKINIAFDLKNYRVIFKPFTDSIPHNHDQSVVDNMKYCNFVNSIIEEEARKGFSIEHIKKMLDYWKTILPDEIGLGSLKTAHIRNKRNKVLPSDHNHHHHANASNDESSVANNASNNNDSVESKNDDATDGKYIDFCYSNLPSNSKCP